MSLLNELSLMNTVNNVNDELLSGSEIPLKERAPIAKWIASRQCVGNSLGFHLSKLRSNTILP